MRAECVGDVFCLLLSLQKLSSLLCFPLLFDVFFNFFFFINRHAKGIKCPDLMGKTQLLFQFGIKIIGCLSSRSFGSKTELIFSGNLFPSVDQPIFKQSVSVHFTTTTNYFYALSVLCSKLLYILLWIFLLCKLLSNAYYFLK